MEPKTVDDQVLEQIIKLRIQRQKVKPAGAVETCAARARRTLTAMQPWLPGTRGWSVLDIGCGLAGIDVLLHLHYQAVLHLLDGEVALANKNGKRLAAFSPDCQPWNSAVEAAAILQQFNIPARAWPPDPELTIPVDVIISTRSWGHHYPVSTYLPLALRSLQPGGLLLLELRRGTDGLQELQKHFRLLGEAPTSLRDKCTLTALVRES